MLRIVVLWSERQSERGLKVSKTVIIKTLAGNETKNKITLVDKIFSVDFNRQLVQLVFNSYRANGRMGTKKNKNRSEVSGGGRKPRAQKGGGCARAGTTRSPIWVGGGVTFAARPRDFYKKVNRKVYRSALKCIFSELVRQNKLHIVESLDVADGKTKVLKSMIQGTFLRDSNPRTIFIRSMDDFSESFDMASRNIVGLSYTSIDSLDIPALVYADQVVVTAEVVKILEKR